MVVAYIICFSLLTVAIKTIQIGTALIVAIGLVFFRDSLTVIKMASIALIILGVVGLNLSGSPH